MFTHEESMLPILQFLGDGKLRKRSEILDAMAIHFSLDADAKREVLPSGTGPLYRSRASWGVTFLHKAGLVDRPQRAYYQLSSSGRALLAISPESLDGEYLREHYPEFRAWSDECRQASKDNHEVDENAGRPVRRDTVSSLSPEEALERAHEILNQSLAEEILEMIATCTPQFFEDLVVKLLVAMGYGGSFEDAARSVGGSGDGGIDGIIKEDRLGLDTIFLQAKRWKSVVGRPEIQKFVGALTGFRAKKGVFITTGRFTSDARTYVENLDAKVVLIDGPKLADLMIEVGLGVSLVQSYEVKRLDSDFFEE